MKDHLYVKNMLFNDTKNFYFLKKEKRYGKTKLY